MPFSWLRARRRRALAGRPFPAAWDEVLVRLVKQAQWLDAAAVERLRRWILVFLGEKRFEGCGGLEISDEIRVAVAGQAGLVTLGFAAEHFDGLRSVLVYPGDYLVPRTTPLAGGGELAWQEARVGETWEGGSMVLAWPEVVAGGRMRAGPRSVVIHECAHLFDLLDGEIDGIPPLPAATRHGWLAAWAERRAHFERLLDEGRATAFDDYAAESPAEFFAVASECFLQDPHALLRHDRTLYELLATAWRQAEVEPLLGALGSIEELSRAFAPRRVSCPLSDGRRGEGLRLTPRTALSWAIPEGTERFRATIRPAAGLLGPDALRSAAGAPAASRTGMRAESRFTVTIDGREVLATGVAEERDIDIPVDDGRTLTILCDYPSVADGGIGPFGGGVVLIDPRLEQ